MCPKDPTAPCHEGAKQGTVTISRYDGGKGGTVAGTFDITFPDGHVTGTFAALRCT
ncbi:MAG: hypothetical protein NVS3B20_21050 [Polyangiales bacterium]